VSTKAFLASLPTKNGVGPSTILLPRGPWILVIDFLAERFPHIAQDELVARMMRGDVLDQSGLKISPDHVYQACKRLYYYRDIPVEPRIPFDEIILFKDKHIVAGGALRARDSSGAVEAEAGH